MARPRPAPNLLDLRLEALRKAQGACDARWPSFGAREIDRDCAAGGGRHGVGPRFKTLFEFLVDGDTIRVGLLTQHCEQLRLFEVHSRFCLADFETWVCFVFGCSRFR